MTDEEIVETVMKEIEDASDLQEIREDPDVVDLDDNNDAESESGKANESEIISILTRFLRILAQSKALILHNSLDPKAIEALDIVENVIASKVKTSRHQTNIRPFFSMWSMYVHILVQSSQISAAWQFTCVIYWILAVQQFTCII